MVGRETSNPALIDIPAMPGGARLQHPVRALPASHRNQLGKNLLLFWTEGALFVAPLMGHAFKMSWPTFTCFDARPRAMREAEYLGCRRMFG